MGEVSHGQGIFKVKFLPLGKWIRTLCQENLKHQFIQLSDYLDFVEIELRAKYMNTRCENGDILVQMVKNVINPWRGSKFMDLTERAHAINCYAISKIWYRWGSINLREGDVSLILSLVKAWLYHDMCVKPSELALFRPTDRGGLGLMHINTRAQAILIRSFLETAVNPMY